MKKTFIIGITAVLAVCLVAAGALAFGFGGLGGHAPSNQTRAAIAAGDYNAFVASLNGTGNVTEAQFTTLTQRVQRGAAMRTAQTAAQAAIANNDYAAWQAALAPVTTNATTLTQDRFNGLVQLHQDEAAVQAAVTANDFAAWKQAVGQLETTRVSMLTQADFTKAVQRSHTKAQNGANMPGPGGHGGRGGQGFRGFGAGLPPSATA